MRVLAFGAHPDDIEFRMAGTLAKYAARGDEVYMCVATDGQIGSYGMSRQEIAEMRHKEAQASCDVIGAHLGLSYKGTAAVYYRAIQKLKRSIKGVNNCDI